VKVRTRKGKNGNEERSENKKEVLEELIAYFPLTKHGQHGIQENWRGKMTYRQQVIS
jgi:hypothetical protein